MQESISTDLLRHHTARSVSYTHLLVNYSGLTVEQDTALRKELREAGVVYKVYKNTMMHRAFEGTPVSYTHLYQNPKSGGKNERTVFIQNRDQTQNFYGNCEDGI